LKIAILAGCAAAAFALAAPAQNLVIIKTVGPNSAAAINKSSDLGTLEPGKIANIADIAIIDGDPLQHVFNLTHVLVVKDGGAVIDHHGQNN
jgi:imidazolonepropionase-like amidohydrolase